MKFQLGGVGYTIVFGYPELEPGYTCGPLDCRLWIPPVRGVNCRLIQDGPDEVLLSSGTARCNRADNFRKETGRKLALTRAIAHAKLSKPDRAVIWTAYLSRAKVSPAGAGILKRRLERQTSAVPDSGAS